MPTPQSSTELCSAIRQEHRALRQLLDSIQSGLESSTADADPMDARLIALVGQLEMHFRNEEENQGLFAQLVTEAPRAEHAVERFRADHQSLLESARDLANHAHQHIVWRQIAFRKFRDFKTKLSQHEQQEDDWLQEVYLDDVEAQD